MRLTVEEHPEAVKRYGHVKPARASKMGPCSTRCPGTTRTCSLAVGHSGPHVAHRSFRRVVAVWDSASGTGASRSAVSRTAAARSPGHASTGRPVGLRTGRPVGVIRALWQSLTRTISSGEELAFLILFILFVGFAIQWLLLLLG